jgi:hypothetical protein
MNAASGSSSTLKYVLYILVAVVAVYLVSRLVFQGSSLEVPVTTTVMTGAPAPGATADSKRFYITKSGDKNNSAIQIKPGGEYTFSFWVYIDAWAGGKATSILNITDSVITSRSLLSVLLYPSSPTMAIRLATDNAPTTDYTVDATRGLLIGGTAGTGSTGLNAASPCDLQNIDMQRWICVTVCTSGRIVDIYYDGKLNRSCILPGAILGPTRGSNQTVTIGEAGGFTGSLGVINYYAYALTPDRIYSIYLAGPGGPPTFMSYLTTQFGQLGINLTYTS